MRPLSLADAQAGRSHAVSTFQTWPLPESLVGREENGARRGLPINEIGSSCDRKSELIGTHRISGTIQHLEWSRIWRDALPSNRTLDVVKRVSGAGVGTPLPDFAGGYGP